MPRENTYADLSALRDQNRLRHEYLERQHRRGERSDRMVEEDESAVRGSSSESDVDSTTAQASPERK